MNHDMPLQDRPAGEPGTASDLDRSRALLLQQQANLLRSCGTLTEAEGNHEGDRTADDAGDQASYSSEQDVSLEILGRARIELEKIAISLEQMDRGTYGLCEDCANPIPAARLEALPTATSCIPCKTRKENAAP